MAISFPSSPSTNQTYTVGAKSWIWNGYAWDLLIANSVSVSATAQSASANTIYTQGVDATQNTRLSTVEANTIYLFGALNQTNTNIVNANTQLKSYVDGQINNTLNYSNGIDVAQNTRLSTVEANTIYLFGALNQTNTNIVNANTQLKAYTDGAIVSANTQLKSYVDGQINNTLNYSNGIDVAQNTRLSTVEANTIYLFGALNQTNTNIVNANTQLKAYTDGIVSSANTQLKAYSDGTFYTKTGGTISGPVSINSNLLVTGNLTVSGNVSIVYANNLAIQDNMIYLNQGDSGNVNPDLGITGAYNDGTYHHAGFFRDHATGVWKVFDNYLPEPDASAWIDQSNSSFRIADFQANNVTFAKISTSSTAAVANLNSDLLDGQHGSYYTTAGNLSGTIPSTVLGNSTHYIGTTAIALNRASGSQALTGITSIDGTATNITAYTINQNLGTTNTPTFAGTSLTTTNPTAASGVVPSFATMNGGRTYTGYDLLNSQPYLYETRFVNIAASSNVASGMTGMGYWFGMGAGDTTPRGFSLMGTSGSGMWYKEHSGSSWYRLLDTANYSSYASPLAGSTSLTTTGTVTSGTWSGSFGAVSGANLTNLTAGNLTGTIPTTVIANSKLVDWKNTTAQWSLHGGGIVIYNGSNVLWGTRVIAIPVENTEYSSVGYIDITCPTSGTVTYYNSAGVTTTVTPTAYGIPLGAWEAIYYQVTEGQTSASDQTKFRVVNYQNTVWSPGPGWILLAVKNGDDSSVKWMPGQVNIPSGGTYTSSTGVGNWLSPVAGSSSITTVGTLTSLTVSGVSSLYSISVPNATGNPGLQIVTNQGTAYNSAIINNWGNSSNPGVMVGTTRSDGTAFQVSASVPLTGGLPSGTGTSLFSVTGSGSVIHGTAANNITITPTSISYNSSVPAAFGLYKPSNSRIDFTLGGLNSSSPGPFWQGLHFATPDTITVNGANQFPRVGAYWSYTSTSNPTDLTFNLYAGNYAAANVMNMVIGTGSAGSVSFDTNGTKRTYIDASGNLYPAVNNSYNLGTSTNYWSNVYATNHYGSGANLTNLTAGNLSGTIPSAVLGNSTHYIGTTAIALNRSSSAQTLTGVSISGDSTSSSSLYALPDTGGTAQWIFLGTWSSASQSGSKVNIELTIGAGYNASITQNSIYKIFFKTSNNSSSQPGSSGNFYADGMAWRFGPSGTVSNLRIIQNSSSSYAFYINCGSYTGANSVYTVSLGQGVWTNSSTLASPSGNYIDLPIYMALDSNNYTSYSPSLTGTGASGTWGINVTGTAGGIATTTNLQVNSIGVNTAASGTAGEIRATSTITAYYSDRRLKDIKSTIPNALEKTLSLSGVLFTQNEKAEEFGYNNYEQQVGVIAQEVQKVLPEAIKPAPFDVNENNESISGENYLTVQYEKLVPLLIEAIKEQQKQIDELKSIINSNK